eukprot:7486162-Alexandrium_andersonii.AAC.1
MRVVPLHHDFAEPPPAVAVAAPSGPAAKQHLTTLRVTVWRDYLSADDWATAKGHPSAFALQGLPTKHLAGSDAVWKDVEDRGNMVALMSYIKVAADQATTLEAA